MHIILDTILDEDISFFVRLQIERNNIIFCVLIRWLTYRTFPFCSFETVISLALSIW